VRHLRRRAGLPLTARIIDAMSALPGDFEPLIAGDAQAAARIADLQQALAGIRHQPSVAVLESLQPPALCARVVHAVVAAAGGRPAFDDGDLVHTWDDVLWVQPEMLVFSLPGRSLDDMIAEFVAVADLPVWRDLPATYLNQIYAADLGASPLDAAELLAGLLHPDRRPAPTPERARRVSPLVRVELRL
jgi:ABC-type Fe3+-hydroxamate transport system substrate-binding protein